MATRELTADMLTAIVAGTVYPVILFEGEFVDAGTGLPEYLRLWTGVGTLSWDGKSWLGGEQLLGISPLEETQEVKAAGFTVSLSGMASANVQRALAGIRQNKPGTLWLAFLTPAGAVVADPYQLQQGRFDITVLEDNGETCTIAAQYESRLVDLERPRERRYTSEDQQLDFPADKGFDQVPELQNLDLLWGR